MEYDKDTEEVSSSSSYASPQGTQPHKNAPPVSRGTQVILKGKIWMEMENALVLNVDWRGRNFAGILLDANATDFRIPEGLQSCRQSPLKIKKCKPLEKYKMTDYGISHSQRKRATYSSKYRRSFVDKMNIVESKLRYGRDKKVGSYSSCPNSPKRCITRIFRNSVGDMRSISVTDSDLKRSSLNSENHQTFLPASESLSNIKIKCNIGDKDTQCNEVDSTGTSNFSERT